VPRLDILVVGIASGLIRAWACLARGKPFIFELWWCWLMFDVEVNVRWLEACAHARDTARWQARRVLPPLHGRRRPQDGPSSRCMFGQVADSEHGLKAIFIDALALPLSLPHTALSSLRLYARRHWTHTIRQTDKSRHG